MGHGRTSVYEQQAASGYSEQLSKVTFGRFRQWNSTVIAVKYDLEVTVFPRLRSFAFLPNNVVDYIQWDLLHLCLESEFSNCLPAGFFAALSYWYQAGHFPCGWAGHFPDGRHKIY